MKPANDGPLLNAAINTWLATDQGDTCISGDASGKYLKNRIEAAFIAGWDARKSLVSSARAPEACKHGIRWPHECSDCEHELAGRIASATESPSPRWRPHTETPAETEPTSCLIASRDPQSDRPGEAVIDGIYIWRDGRFEHEDTDRVATPPFFWIRERDLTALVPPELVDFIKLRASLRDLSARDPALKFHVPTPEMIAVEVRIGYAKFGRERVQRLLDELGVGEKWGVSVRNARSRSLRWFSEKRR